jgi:two-component system, chemotaxis family, chemotaxis protein CheY
MVTRLDLGVARVVTNVSVAYGDARSLRPAEPTVPGSVVGPPGARKFVLIVDDDADVRESLAAFIKILGNGRAPVVRGVPSAEDGLEAMTDQYYDLVLSDYHMGKMNGVDFLDIARQMEPGVPCLLMSADRDGAQDRLAFLKQSNVAFMTKPFDTERLKDLLNQSLGFGN